MDPLPLCQHLDTLDQRHDIGMVELLENQDLLCEALYVSSTRKDA